MKIELQSGSNIESAVYTLLAAKARGESAYVDFNGHKLYSDTVTMDSAYIEITGKSKADFEKAKQEWSEKYKLEKQEATRKAQENIPNWIQRGQIFIFPERYEDWEKCVLSRASDLYHGKELDAALDIMQVLENGETLESAKKMFEDQAHSNMSGSIVRNILFSFSSKGPDFWEVTATGTISNENRKLLEEKKKENTVLANNNSKSTDNKVFRKTI